MPSIPHIKVGQPITADLLNRIADRLEPWSKMTVAQGSHLNFLDGPFGKALVLMLPREIPARLIGDSSPYAWTALTEEPDGEYSDRTGGLLGGDVAYEINGKADLDGKVVMLRWTAAGDWRFQWVGYSSCGWLISAIGCNSRRVGGCTIELFQGGVLIADGVSSASAGTLFSVPQGSYDVVITPEPGSGFTTFTESRAFSCTVTDDVDNCTLPIDTANFRCGCAGAYPWPLVMHGTDFQGGITLTYGLGGVAYWRTPVLSAAGDVVPDAGACVVSPGAYDYGYSIMSCGGTGGQQPILQVNWLIRCCTGLIPRARWKTDGTIVAIGSGPRAIAGTLSENPFMLTVPIGGLATGGAGCLDSDPGNGSIPPGDGSVITLTG